MACGGVTLTSVLVVTSPLHLTLLPSSYKDLGMTWSHVGKPGPSPHLKALSVITSARALCPGKVPCAQVQGLGQGHFWGLQWASPNMRKQVTSFLLSLFLSLSSFPSLPCTSTAPWFQPDFVLEFGDDDVSVLMELPVCSRGETYVQREFHGCVSSGSPASWGDRSDLSTVIGGTRRC